MGFVCVVISGVVSVLSVPASTDVVVIGELGMVIVVIFPDGSDVDGTVDGTVDGSVDGSVDESVLCVVCSVDCDGLDDGVVGSVVVDISGEILPVELSELEFVVSVV